MNAPRIHVPQADAIIAAVRKRGNEPLGTSLRDAAHEAFHEMEARAVEQAVCKALGVDCGTLDQWVFTSSMEAIKRGLPHGEYNPSLAYVERYMTTAACAEWAAKIIALGEVTP
jgi:hypothetical protein